MWVDKQFLAQVINPAPLDSNNPTGQSIYSGPAYWPGNGGQVFVRGRRSNQALYRYALEACLYMLVIACYVMQ